MTPGKSIEKRTAPVDLEPAEFRRLGHELVDRMAELLGSLSDRPVTTGEPPGAIRDRLGQGPLPREGEEPEALLRRTTDLLLEHSLFNSHPRFYGYITAPGTPIGILGDLLASTINPNMGGFQLSPVGTEIEAQTVRWIAELVGYHSDCGGLLVSGGNMANFVGFLAARRRKAPGDPRRDGMSGGKTLISYCSAETHTWIQKAADLFGLGTKSIRWIPTDAKLSLRTDALREQIARDRADGHQPFFVVGTAGSVSTGAIDPLEDIAAICRENELWFHVDGAYGAPAASVPEQAPDFKGMEQADSIAVDPHKWLYAPLEAGCVLVRSPQDLIDTFSYSPPYYHLDRGEKEAPINYFEHGPQNSRGFRALKVWLALKQAGRAGYEKMIGDDIRLARHLSEIVAHHPELEAGPGGLSIATFRYVPPGLEAGPERDARLDRLNTALLTRIQLGGEAFLSNAVIQERYWLRACIVNFRTSLADVDALPELVVRLGREIHSQDTGTTGGEFKDPAG